MAIFLIMYVCTCNSVGAGGLARGRNGARDAGAVVQLSTGTDLKPSSCNMDLV